VIRVVVADDQPLIRAGLRAMLDHAPDMALEAEAADGEEAVAMAYRHRPDVVLMDIRMPRLDGIEATRRITTDAALDAVRVLVLTPLGFLDFEKRFPDLHAGVADENIDARKLGDHLLEHGVDFGGNTDVRTNRQGTASEIAQTRGGGFRALAVGVIVNSDITTLAREFFGDTTPNSLAGARHQGNLVG
jgi:hypothetical protein